MTDLTRSDYLKSTDLKTTRRRITDTLEAEALRLLTEERDYYVSIGREDLACQVEGLEVEVEVRPRGICKQERIEELKEENRLLIVEQEEYCSELRAWMRAATEAIERITGTEWDDDPEPVNPEALFSVAAKAGVYRERIEELRLKITKTIAEREDYRRACEYVSVYMTGSPDIEGGDPLQLCKDLVGQTESLSKTLIRERRWYEQEIFRINARIGRILEANQK